MFYSVKREQMETKIVSIFKYFIRNWFCMEVQIHSEKLLQTIFGKFLHRVIKRQHNAKNEIVDSWKMAIPTEKI